MKQTQKRKRLTADGLPIDISDWTVEDWIDLHRGFEAIKRKIAKRHKPAKEAKPCPSTPPDTST